MTVYVWFCKKCDSLVESTCSLGRKKQQVWDAGMQDKVKHHDLEQHGFDMAPPAGWIARFVSDSNSWGRKVKRQ